LSFAAVISRARAGIHRLGNPLGELLGAVRIKEQRPGAGHLPEHRDVAARHRRAGLLRLDDRQTEAFCNCRHDEAARAAV
jgi:hypothetical protein